MIQLSMLLIYLDHLDNDGGDDDYDGKRKASKEVTVSGRHFSDYNY